MFAIIEAGGKQYIVEKGQTLDVEKIDEKAGSTFTIDKVLLINDNGTTKIGTPFIEGAYVETKLSTHKKGEKVCIFKYKAKDRYQKKTGHRQSLTTIEVLDIKASGGKAKVEKVKEEVKEKKAPAPKKEVKKTVKKTAKK